MSEINTLTAYVRRIGQNMNNLLKTDSNDPSLAGWGQFLEATSTVHQIGPYGTAAGVVVNEIAFSTGSIDARVKAQLRKFWDEKPNGKMFPQNVRLAFTVLALAKSKDSDLVNLRDEIAKEIRARQNTDGSWNDAKPHGTSTATGQPDATAWTILALRRCGGSDAAVQKGAQWLASMVDGSGRTTLLSTIGIAAAIAGHAAPRTAPDLRVRGFEILTEAVFDREELISFYDYEEHTNGTQVQKRDYLCFPAFYPLAVLAAGLGVEASLLENIRLNAFRYDAIRRLAELSEGHTYKSNLTARFSSSVDQAMYALAYEELADAEMASWMPTGFLAFIYNWCRRSIIVNLLLPVIGFLFLAFLLASPVWTASLIADLIGKSAAPIVTFATIHNDKIQIIDGLSATLLFATPQRGRVLLTKWIRKHFK